MIKQGHTTNSRQEIIGNATLYLDDCLNVLPSLKDIDSCVTDPPYGLKFMGKDWDHGVPGERFWRAILDACRPGAHLLAFGGTRTYHRLVCAIEDAGWEIRDTIMWVYGSGFPKSLDVSKAIDKGAGAKREVVGRRIDRAATPKRDFRGGAFHAGAENKNIDCSAITAPATGAAKQWDGWGTALKPAVELICLARKPLSEKTVAANILKHGVGGLNIDGCRIPVDPDVDASQLRTMNRGQRADDQEWGFSKKGGNTPQVIRPEGRFPANLVHDGSEEVMGLFPVTTSGKLLTHHKQSGGGLAGTLTFAIRERTGEPCSFGGDSGSAARFFYCAKASGKDRNEGLEDLKDMVLARSCQAQAEEKRGHVVKKSGGAFNKARIVKNNHPTVKPTNLMRYLCRLITPPGGGVLDPFMGSGSTGKAAVPEGFQFVGIENEEPSFNIACKRMEKAENDLLVQNSKGEQMTL